MNDLVEGFSPGIALRRLVDRLSARGWITGPQIAVHPTGIRLADTDLLRLLVPRRHVLTAITWPGVSR